MKNVFDMLKDIVWEDKIDKYKNITFSEAIENYYASHGMEVDISQAIRETAIIVKSRTPEPNIDYKEFYKVCCCTDTTNVIVIYIEKIIGFNDPYGELEGIE